MLRRNGGLNHRRVVFEYDETIKQCHGRSEIPSNMEDAKRIAAGPHREFKLSGTTERGLPWMIYLGDAADVLKTLEANRFDCVITSPPYYWQRDYKVEGQLGKEKKIEAYVDAIADVMNEVFRVLKKTGVLFLNLGDTYYSGRGQPKGKDPKSRARRFGLRAVDASGLGVPRKTIIGIPWRVAIEMIRRDWILRSPIIWRREGSLPEPTAKDRPWKTYETVFMFTKSQKYHFNREPLGKEQDVWLISDRAKGSNGLHSAAFPDRLVSRCLDVGCPAGGEVLDPFVGTGTVLRVALESGRPATGIDLSFDYCQYAAKYIHQL